MKVFVTGARGQLGRATSEVAARRGHTVAAPDVDVRDAKAVADALAVVGPDLVINAAAFTDVDRAEQDHALAFEINRDGAGVVARQCEHRHVRLLHLSTNYVFDGATKQPCTEYAPLAPLNVYGASKAAGELLVNAAGGTVVRTSWLFSASGPSFVQKVLRLARDDAKLGFIDDQHGSPTACDDLAGALLDLAEHEHLEPIYHYCGDGSATWYGFARAILELVGSKAELVPVASSDRPSLAKRPAFAVLDTSRIRTLGIVPSAWTDALARVLASRT